MQQRASLNIGLVGANWGATHIEAWRQVEGVTVAAVCTSSEATATAAAAKYRIAKAYGDAAALLADPSIDIMDVTPRPSIRAPIVEAALRAGKHVLQPLPFALSLKQGRWLQECARRAHVVAMVESLHRYAPAFLQAKTIVEQGELGQIHTVRAHVRTGILIDPPPDYVYRWIIDAANGASALRNFGAHLLHTLVWLLGEIEQVAAHISTRFPSISFTDGSSERNGVADNASLLLQFVSGATGEMSVSWSEPGADGFLIDVVGSLRRLVLRADGLGPQNARLQVGSAKKSTLQTLPVTPPVEAAGAAHPSTSGHARAHELACMCAAMASAVRSNEPTAAQPHFGQAFTIMQVVEAAYVSGAERRWVSVCAL